MEVSDPTLMRPLAPSGPADAPTVRTSATRPRTAPFPAQDGDGREDDRAGRDAGRDGPTTPPVGTRAPFWKRLLGRG